VIDGGKEVGHINLVGDTADLWPRLVSTLSLTLLASVVALAIGLLIAVVCGVASLGGFVLLETASDATRAFINMFAGGAILVMLADTMIPEAFEHGGKLAGLVNVMGFALAAYFSTAS
jgi:zinc transporter ZupT